MKKVIASTLMSLALAGSAYAGDGNRSGLYFGAGVGNAGYSDNDLSVVLSGGSEVEKTASGVKGYLGYQFNNVVGIELGYADYGKYKAVNKTNPYSYAAKSYSVAANLGYSFWKSQLRPFINIGLAYLSTKHEGLTARMKDLTNDSNVGVHYGVGFQVEPNILYGLGFRVAYEADTYMTRITSNSIYIQDKTYTQTSNLLYAAVQYKF